MKKAKSSKTGGLVLKRKELEEILNQEKTIGLAFGVEKPGYAENVNLIVYRVFEGINELLGEVVNLKYKEGAADAGASCSKCEDYIFQYSKNLNLNGFDFAYLRKSEYENLFNSSSEEKEVFIAGVLTDYGNLGEIEGEWFTFSIVPRKEKKLDLNESIKTTKIKSLSNPPRIEFMAGCPPIWDAFPPDGDENAITQIKFKKKVHA